MSVESAAEDPDAVLRSPVCGPGARCLRHARHPAAPDPARVAIDQLAEGNSHRFLDHTRLVHMAADLEQLGALVALAPEAGEPGRAAPHDGGGNGNGQTQALGMKEDNALHNIHKSSITIFCHSHINEQFLQ